MSKILQTEIRQANGAVFIAQIDLDCKIPKAPHFTYYEFANPSCKEQTKLVITPKFYKHVEMVEAHRVLINKGYVINSGYRSPSFNKQCGGIDTSNHVYGTGSGIACDVATPWITTEAEFNDFAAKWKAICESSGIIGEALWYKKSKFVHLGSFIDYSKTFYKVVYNK